MNIEELWYEYKSYKSSKAKQKLIKNYLNLVKIISGRMYNFYGGSIEYDELVGFGVFGLIDAIDKFEIERNLKFETYAQIRIRGAIIDGLRKLDWVPRGVRKKSKELERVVSELENKLGRSATNIEIAQKMNLTIEQLNELLSEVTNLNIVSLEETLQTNVNLDTFENTQKNPEDTYEEKEIKNILVEAIDSLSDNEKLVISLYYYENLTYKEIGSILDLSESRISQIHSRAIIKMKSNLGKQGIENY